MRALRGCLITQAGGINVFKRICIICFLLMLMFVHAVLLLPGASYADVVFGNDFFYENKDKMEPVDENSRWNRRIFVVNSPAGFVYAKDEPGLGYQEGNKLFSNGEIVSIEATYNHEGEYWGIMPPSHSYMFSGWIPMEKLLLVFEQQDFESVNKDSFYDYTGSYDAVLSAKKLVEWQWPGSDKEKRINDNEDAIARSADVEFAYMDKDGREWGKTIYESWICLSDPGNSKIPAFYPAPDPTRWSPGSNFDWSATDIVRYPAQPQGPPDDDGGGVAFPKIPPDEGGGANPPKVPPGPPGEPTLPVFVAILILAVALAGGTAVLIRVFRKR